MPAGSVIISNIKAEERVQAKSGQRKEREGERGGGIFKLTAICIALCVLLSLFAVEEV